MLIPGIVDDRAKGVIMATRWARVARGWIVALLSTFVAALSHTLGGGSAPGLLAVVLSLAFAGILCIGLAGRTLSLWRTGISVALSQLIFHGLFSLGSGGGTLLTQSDTGAIGGAHQHQVVATVASVASSGDALATGNAFATSNALVAGNTLVANAAPVHSMFAHDAGMWVAHAVAAVLTIAMLRHGERAFWSLFASAALAIRSVWTPISPVRVPGLSHALPPVARVFVPRALSTLLSSMRHRGPPLALCAA